MYKTFSSPNLRDQTSLDRSGFNRRSRPGTPSIHDLSQSEQRANFFVVGDRVLVDRNRAGSVAYFGELDFSSGDWVGVVLDEPSGNHDGKIHGREYFHCAPQHGLFVRPTRLTRFPSENIGSNYHTTGRRAVTPTQRHEQQQQQDRSTFQSPAGYSSGRSTSESYYYDDDYRSPRSPSIENLERKLRTIKNYDNTYDLRRRPGQTLSSATSQLSSSMSPSPSYIDRTPTNLNDHQSKTVFNFRPQRIRVDDYATTTPVASDNNSHLIRSMSQSASNLNRTTPSQSTTKLLDFSSKPLHLHDRVSVKSTERVHPISGTLRFLGETQFATGEWAGVELDEPEGRNDGSVLGVRYFNCPDGYGIFVPASRVSRLSPKVDFANSVKSTIKSPPPNFNRYYGDNSISGRSSTTSPASYYDRYESSATPSSLSSSTPSVYNHHDQRYHQNDRTNFIDRSTSPSPYNSSNVARSRPVLTRETDQNVTQPNYGSSSAYSSSNFSSGSTQNNYKPAKYRESDLDNALRRYTRKPKQSSPDTYEIHSDRPQPRSIKYTFKSSKYDGNPIAMKTVEY